MKFLLRRQEAEMIEVVSEEEAKQASRQKLYIMKDCPKTLSVKEEDMKRLALGKRRTINVALVGNPNSGKTSLFNLASGAHEHVGNYSGVTVDAKEGYFDFEGYHFRIVDLPGTYSLIWLIHRKKFMSAVILLTKRRMLSSMSLILPNLERESVSRLPS